MEIVKKDIRYIYTDSNYEFELEIIVCTSISKALNKLYKRWKFNGDVIESEGCVTYKESDKGTINYALLLKFDQLNHNVIAHEVLHLTAFILDDRQIDMKGSDDAYENMAWLNGHLSQIVYQILEKEGLVLNKPLIPAKLNKK